MALKDWSTTAADNDDADAAINWLEGQAPSTVNNSSRAMMAAHATQYASDQWHWAERGGVSLSIASQTAFKLGTSGGDLTSIFHAGRKVRLTSGSSDRYAYVVSSSYTSETTVTVGVENGSLSASHSKVALGPQVNTSPIGVNTAGVAATAGLLISGTYTPTLTNNSNLDGSAAAVCGYVRIGNAVLVFGSVSVDPTLTATSTSIDLSLPIASDFTADTQARGTATAASVAESGAIFANATDNRVTLQFISAATTNHALSFVFGYQVV